MFPSLIGVTLNLLLLLAGFICYSSIVRKMRSQAINRPPTISLFIIFVTYGALLLVLLTNLFCKWSEMEVIGLVYLGACAPTMMFGIALKFEAKGDLSTFHAWTYRLAVAYNAVAAPVLYILWLLTKWRVKSPFSLQ